MIAGTVAMLALAATPVANAAVEVGNNCEKPKAIVYSVPTTQAECPTVSLEALALASRRSASALVAVSSKAPVSVSGVVTVPKIRKRAGGQIQLGAPTQTVEPGRIGRFELPFPGLLLSALKALPSKRSLTLTLSVSATDLIGRVTTTSSVVQLKGQSKAKARKVSGSS